MYIRKHERIIIQIAIGLILIGMVIEGIRYITEGPNRELKHVKTIRIQK